MQPHRPGVRLSVVVAAWNGNPALERCLQSLGNDLTNPDVEVIAVRNFTEDFPGDLERKFPAVEHVEMSLRTPVPLLRSCGILRCHGAIVALAEDHCTFGRNWASEVKNAHRLPYPAIGGAVENRENQAGLDLATYLYDYGAYMLPRNAEFAGSLSGNNVSYKRAILCDLESEIAAGVYEPFFHGAIQARGGKLFFLPTLVVFHEKSYRAKTAISLSFHLARNFGAQRADRVSFGRRLLLIFGTPVLPALLPYRIISRALRRKRYNSEMPGAAGWICVLMASWSVGEFCGYVAGAGASAEKWA